MAYDARWISLDDSDSKIWYDEGWYSDEYPESPFRRTTPWTACRISGCSLHWTNRTAGLNLNFTATSLGSVCTGVAVELHGGASSNSQASWECFVDNKRLDLPSKLAAPVEGNRHQLCRWMGADTSAHVLTLKVTRLPPGQRFWVDRIRYLASDYPSAAAIERPIPIVLDDYPEEAVLQLEPREEGTKEGVPPVLIVIGVLGGLAVVGTLVISYWLRKRQKQHEAALELKERGVLLGLRGVPPASDIDTPHSTAGPAFDNSSAVDLPSAHSKLPKVPPGLEPFSGRGKEDSGALPTPSQSIR
ncbi:hypothetical protein MD484_g3443, partial [Candolleomyces efflorescens]